MIRTIFFDAGNTLVYVNMEHVSLTLARYGVRRSPDELWTAEHRARIRVDDPAVITQSTDQTRWATYFSSRLEEAGVRLDYRPILEDLKGYHEAHNLWEVVPPSVPPLLGRLKKQYALAVISNSNGGVAEKFRRLGLEDFFGVIIDSAVEGVEKPDPEIFRIALRRMSARPEESVHVGDFYHIDAVGACRAGIRPILIDPIGLQADKDCRRIRRIDEIESAL